MLSGKNVDLGQPKQNLESTGPECRTRVQIIEVEDQAGQRLDNFLLARLKGVPKSLIYRIIRKGEVRVNAKRATPETRLQTGDKVRVPPVRMAPAVEPPVPVKLNQVQALESRILFEQEGVIVINKPAGIAVHGGSGLDYGLIEAMRALRPQAKHLELVHRLDKDTSGCLLLATKHSVLNLLQQQLRDKTMQKTYQALVSGHWSKRRLQVSQPLEKYLLANGERRVKVSQQGKDSLTYYRLLQQFANCSLIEASPKTGRTHQIRVHCLHAGHAILGDDKYAEPELNRQAVEQLGLKRLFLHAAAIEFALPSGNRIRIEAPLEPELEQVLQRLKAQV